MAWRLVSSYCLYKPPLPGHKSSSSFSSYPSYSSSSVYGGPSSTFFRPPAPSPANSELSGALEDAAATRALGSSSRSNSLLQHPSLPTDFRIESIAKEELTSETVAAAGGGDTQRNNWQDRFIDSMALGSENNAVSSLPSPAMAKVPEVSDGTFQVSLGHWWHFLLKQWHT